MPRLILKLNQGESIAITAPGLPGAVTVRYAGPADGGIRLAFEADKSVRILRSDAVKREPPEVQG